LETWFSSINGDARTTTGTSIMMKDTITHATLAASLLVGAAVAAHAGGFHAGGSVGGSDWNGRVNGVQGDRSGVSGKLFWGLRVLAHFSLEGGAMSLGHTREEGVGKASGDGATSTPSADMSSRRSGRCWAAAVSPARGFRRLAATPRATA
jgi:hypothetical protein